MTCTCCFGIICDILLLSFYWYDVYFSCVGDVSTRHLRRVFRVRQQGGPQCPDDGVDGSTVVHRHRPHNAAPRPRLHHRHQPLVSRVRRTAQHTQRYKTTSPWDGDRKGLNRGLSQDTQTPKGEAKSQQICLGGKG